jgi:hypothetical protein
VGRSSDRVRTNRLGDPRRIAIEHGACRLGSNVARSETGPASRQHDPRSRGERLQLRFDRVPLVRYDAPLDLVALPLQQRGERIAAPVLAGAGVDTVGDRQDGRLQTGSFVFSTSSTPSILIAGSIAFAMS